MNNFNALHRYIRKFTNITAQALQTKFKGEKSYEPKNLHRLHRHTEFLVAYLFEKIFPAHKLLNDNYAKNKYKMTWVGILAPIIADETMNFNSNINGIQKNSFVDYYNAEGKLRAEIEKNIKDFEEKKIFTKETAINKYDSLCETFYKLEETIDIKPFENLNKSTLNKLKEIVFNQWIKDVGIDSNKIPCLNDDHTIANLFNKGKFKSDNKCWFALHFWHPHTGEEFANRKLLLLIGNQWNDRLYRIAEIFAYLPLTLPKIAFNPKETIEAALKLAEKDNRLAGLCKEKDKEKDIHERQGIIVITDEELYCTAGTECTYLKELGIKIKCDFLPRIQNADVTHCNKGGNNKKNGLNHGNDLCYFFENILNMPYPSSYLRLVASNEYLDILSKQLDDNNGIIKEFKDYKDDDCKSKCKPKGVLKENCIGTKCIAHQIHENVNAHLTAKGAAFLLQSFLTWNWKYMYMFPGALWDTVIGGVGCSFLKPLDDYEFQCMRILVRDMLTPYTILEKRMVELSAEKQEYYKKLESGNKLASTIVSQVHTMSQEIRKRSREYLSVLDTSLTEQIWSLFKEKALCVLTHATAKKEVVDKYAGKTYEELIVKSIEEIKEIPFPESDYLSSLSAFESTLRECFNDCLSEQLNLNIYYIQHGNCDGKKKDLYLIDLATTLNIRVSFRAELFVHNKNDFINTINELRSIGSIEGRNITIKLKQENYKQKYLITLIVTASMIGNSVFNPAGNLEYALKHLKNYCYMGFVYNGNTFIEDFTEPPLNNKDTENIFNNYKADMINGSIYIMFCFSRGISS